MGDERLLAKHETILFVALYIVVGFMDILLT
jgi:hypothetical protein